MRITVVGIVGIVALVIAAVLAVRLSKKEERSGIRA